MYVLTRPFLIGFFGISLAMLMDSAPAASLAPSGWEQLAGCAQRVNELQAEVEMLREQLRERPALTSNSSVKRLPDYDARALSMRNEGIDCTVPFAISRRGIKRFKEGCEYMLSEVDPCDLPYEVDARGVKNFKPGCRPTR
jgi:hypothetical protein